MSERLRLLAASIGLIWWIGFPFAYLAGTHGRWEHRCAGRTFTGEFDDCFNDALPVLELLAFPLTLILAYPFARFAFSMFGPESDLRSFKWRLASSSGGVEHFPSFQIAAAIGFTWASFHLFSMPLAIQYWYLQTYWILWLGWFALGAYASSPLAYHRISDDD